MPFSPKICGEEYEEVFIIDWLVDEWMLPMPVSTFSFTCLIPSAEDLKPFIPCPLFSKGMAEIKHGVKQLGLVLSTTPRNTYDKFAKTFLSSGSVQGKAQPVILPFVVSFWTVVESLGIGTFWRRRKAVASAAKNKTCVKRCRWVRLPSVILMPGYEAELLILLIHDNLIICSHTILRGSLPDWGYLIAENTKQCSAAFSLFNVWLDGWMPYLLHSLLKLEL